MVNYIVALALEKVRSNLKILLFIAILISLSFNNRAEDKIIDTPQITILAADTDDILLPICVGKIAKKCKQYPKRAGKIAKKYKCAC